MWLEIGLSLSVLAAFLLLEYLQRPRPCRLPEAYRLRTTWLEFEQELAQDVRKMKCKSNNSEDAISLFQRFSDSGYWVTHPHLELVARVLAQLPVHANLQSLKWDVYRALPKDKADATFTATSVVESFLTHAKSELYTATVRHLDILQRPWDQTPRDEWTVFLHPHAPTAVKALAHLILDCDHAKAVPYVTAIQAAQVPLFVFTPSFWTKFARRMPVPLALRVLQLDNLGGVQPSLLPCELSIYTDTALWHAELLEMQSTFPSLLEKRPTQQTVEEPVLSWRACLAIRHALKNVAVSVPAEACLKRPLNRARAGLQVTDTERIEVPSLATAVYTFPNIQAGVQVSQGATAHGMYMDKATWRFLASTFVNSTALSMENYAPPVLVSSIMTDGSVVVPPSKFRAVNTTVCFEDEGAPRERTLTYYNWMRFATVYANMAPAMAMDTWARLMRRQDRHVVHVRGEGVMLIANNAVYANYGVDVDTLVAPDLDLNLNLKRHADDEE